MFFNNPFLKYETKLGNAAKCAFYFCLMDAGGNTISQTGYEENIPMPLASTRKIPIALMICKKIFADKELSLNTKIKIEDTDLVPGNSQFLDRHFFNENIYKDEKTIEELLAGMLIETDNSATDVLLKILGGSSVVNDLMTKFNFNINLSGTQKDRFSSYYKISLEKSSENFPKVLSTLKTAFEKRDTEEALVSSKEDSCSPLAMSMLLKALIRWAEKKNPLNSNEKWLFESANFILNKMTQCKTGALRIPEGIKDYQKHIEVFGHKSGTLGGITNDVAFFHFNDGHWAVLSIYTCLSDKSFKEREALIATITKNLIHEHVLVNVDKCDKIMPMNKLY